MALVQGYVRHGTDNPSFLDVSFVPGTEESGNPFHPMRESDLRDLRTKELYHSPLWDGSLCSPGARSNVGSDGIRGSELKQRI